MITNFTDTLTDGTVLHGRYRIESFLGNIRHGEFEYSSFVYQATDINGSNCMVFEYFPDDWDCVAKRDKTQTVIWDYEKIRERISMYHFPADISSSAYLNRIFKDYSKDAQKCRYYYHKGIRPRFCVLDCDTFMENGTCYVVLLRIDSDFCLYDFIKSEGTIADRKSVGSMLKYCLEDLEMLHTIGITHGAISPHNIVCYKGKFVLTEFGKPKSRMFSSLVDPTGPAWEGCLWEDPESPLWYNNLKSEIMADTVGVSRIIQFCMTGEWEKNHWEFFPLTFSDNSIR